MSEILYRQVEVRHYVRKNRITGETEEVTVSNRNMLSEEEHLRLLNLNDNAYEYFRGKEINGKTD